MRGPIRSILLAALAVCAFAALTVGQASAARIADEPGEVSLLAIYGYPGASTTSPAVEKAIGGGLGRNFGFGKNMLFRANHTVLPLTENIAIKIGGAEAEAKDSDIGGTLMSNNTGINNPLSFAIQFVDFQNSSVVGFGAVGSYSDTFDRPWISEICSSEAGTVCKVDPRIPGNPLGEVKIENVSVDLGPGFVVQGTVWGLWINGKAGEAPCIKLNLPKAVVATDTLYVTQTAPGFPAVGAVLETIKGEACLISANNDWYEGKQPEIKINNKF
jgi:hypothetical protein